MCIWNAYMLRCLQNGRSSSRSLNLKEIQGPVELSKSHNEKAFGKGIGIVAKIEDEISVGEYAKKVKKHFLWKMSWYLAI